MRRIVDGDHADELLIATNGQNGGMVEQRRKALWDVIGTEGHDRRAS